MSTASEQAMPAGLTREQRSEIIAALKDKVRRAGDHETNIVHMLGDRKFRAVFTTFGRLIIREGDVEIYRTQAGWLWDANAQ